MSKSLITEVPQTELVEMNKEVSPLMVEANAIVINSKDDVEQASLFMRKLAIAIKNVEDKRTSFTAPLTAASKTINATFKEISTPLENAKKVVETKILKWRKEEQDRIAKEEARRQKIQEAHEAKGHKVSAPVELPKLEKTTGFVQARKIKKWELVDFSQLPEKFKTVDEKLISEAVKSGVENIPGLKIWEEEALATSRF